MDVKTCNQCKEKNDFLIIKTRNGDYTYQYDDKKKRGQLPELSTLTSKGGLNFKICVNCGKIPGLNVGTLRKQLMKEFAENEETSKEETLRKSKAAKPSGSKKNPTARPTGSKTGKAFVTRGSKTAKATSTGSKSAKATSTGSKSAKKETKRPTKEETKPKKRTATIEK